MGQGRGRGEGVVRPPVDERVEQAPTVAELRRQRRRERIGGFYHRYLKRIMTVVLIAAVVVLAFVFAYRSSLFQVRTVEVTGNTHLSEQALTQIAAVPADSTLLRLDADGITSRLEQNPWVSRVSIVRHFPDTIELRITERPVAAIVMVAGAGLSGADEPWAISANGTWLAPVRGIIQASPTDSSKQQGAARQEASGGSSSSGSSSSSSSSSGSSGSSDTSKGPTTDANTAEAASLDANPNAVDVSTISTQVRITGYSSSTAPTAGETCADGGVVNALEILGKVSSSLSSRITSIAAPSAEQTVLTLDNGVEVAFGSSSNAEDKERIVLQLLSEHEGSISYINVRVVDRPTWRGLTS